MSSAVTRRNAFGTRNVLLGLGVVFGPLLFVSTYLVVSRKWHLGVSSNGWGLDYWALGLGLIIGFAFVWKLSIGARARAIVIGGYLLATALFLVVYSLYFVCRVFGDCL